MNMQSESSEMIMQTGNFELLATGTYTHFSQSEDHWA